MKHGNSPQTGSSGGEPGATDWSVRDNGENTMKKTTGKMHGTGPRTGSSEGEPGATDWSVRGNGENTTKRRPGVEHPGQSGAKPGPRDWIV